MKNKKRCETSTDGTIEQAFDHLLNDIHLLKRVHCGKQVCETHFFSLKFSSNDRLCHLLSTSRR